MRNVIIVVAAIAAAATACGSSSQQSAPQSSQASATSAIPEGTEFTARLDQSIVGRQSTPGQFVSFTTTAPLQDRSGRTIAPAGSKVRGRITSVEHGAQPNVRLSIESLQTPRGTFPLVATLRNPGYPGAGFAVDEIYDSAVPYSAVLRSPGRAPAQGAVGGGPTPSENEITIRAGAPVRFILTRPLEAAQREPGPAKQ